MTHRIACYLALIFAFFIFLPIALQAEPCDYMPGPTGLAVRPGYTDFMRPEDLAPFKAALPRVVRAEVDAALRSSETMWYDEASMVFLYQDSVETVVGGRANCVGREVGERNRDNPQISKLLNYFGEDYRFKFPFRTAAGTDNVSNVHILNFWSPPRVNGQVMPVRWWKESARGRWRWLFPVGTIFGEVLYEKGPDNQWYVFEIRMRKRYLSGWEVDAFRPFLSGSDFADAVVDRRPNWQSDTSLRRLIEHLRDPATLTPQRWQSEPYELIFPAIDGALDKMPAINDTALVAELLTSQTFMSVEGAIWREGNGLETYAPSSEGEFSLVPKGYEMGMIPVNEVSCNRCHDQTGRELGDLETHVVLYGEMWGEDRIFTWHLFEPNFYIFSTYDDSDYSTRRPNPRLVQAGLLLNQKPAANDPNYRMLPGPQ